MMRLLSAAFAFGGAVCIALLVPRPSQAWADLTGPVPAHDPNAPLLALLALTVWALMLWLVAGAALVTAGRLPGAAGRLAAAVAERTVPASVRRAVGVVLGTSLALGTVGAVPATASPLDDPRAPATSTSVLPGPSAPSPAPPPAAPDVSLDWPGQAPPGPPTSRPDPADPLPAAPAGSPAAPSTPTSAQADPPQSVPAADPVRPALTVIRPGDCLWALAERDLRATSGARPTHAAVAAAWPTWWAANREVVGDDPDLLLPGTTLVRPPAG